MFAPRPRRRLPARAIRWHLRRECWPALERTLRALVRARGERRAERLASRWLMQRG